VKETHLVITIAIVIVVVVIGSVGILFSQGILKAPTQSSTGKTVYFTIVESDPPSKLAGMNGSYYKSPSGPQWPVMNVTLGDTVVITVMNLNSSYEPHGFAIDHYLNAPGYTMDPGQVRVLTFVANVAGSFRVYCSIECSIHPTMQNGVLYVSS
jgi:FtsP/CotA-like multicopper oxidase with cupredoxin domain